ncbi:MAG: sulfatase-like hydrolase/transferase [Verrucomicrobiota bacterium]
MKSCFQSRSLAIFRVAAAVVFSVFAALLCLEGERPNVLLIMVDDLGYGDLSSYGATDLKTPQIDRLMEQGMRFTDFYANCCVCSPTRAALLSGRYPEFVGVPGVVRTHDKDNWGYLRPESVMLPEVFQEDGYMTVLVGKWHLGLRDLNHPNRRGFQEFRGFLGDMMDDYWTHLRHGNNYMRRNMEVIEPEGHATDLFTDWTIESLKSYAENPGRPFFHFLAYNAPHSPVQPPQEWLDRVLAREPEITRRRAKMVAFVEHLDDAIGKVIQSLDALGLGDDTIVVFTSDNGGRIHYGATNGALRSDKGHVYEGGIKVATSVRWPGVVGRGQVTGFRGLTMDILPTLADICGIEIESEVEGRSFRKLLEEGRQDAFERPVFHMWLQGASKQCMRYGDWKLARDLPGSPFELYNLKSDPLEETDLANREPKRLEEMVSALQFHMMAADRVPWRRPAQ